jgi:glycosyltransferase involved in cell wall biosynthesis
MPVFKEYTNLRGMLFNADSELKLAEMIMGKSQGSWKVMGIGIDTDFRGNGSDFRKKYGVTDPYILYAGRKEVGKNIPLLLEYFTRYKRQCDRSLKLVLIGPESVDIPRESGSDVLDLGFVPLQDKYDAYAASEFLCQPSVNESFSIVIMESWICGRPVLVHADCEVTKDFCRKSDGGLYFKDYREFEGWVDYLLACKSIAAVMGQNGARYVRDHFAWDVIVERYTKYFSELCGDSIEFAHEHSLCGA